MENEKDTLPISQFQQEDELLLLLELSERNNLQDSKCVDKLIELLKTSKEIPEEVLVTCAKRIIHICKTKNNWAGTYDMANCLAEYHWSKANFDQSILYAKILLDTAKQLRSIDKEILALKLIGNNYLRKGLLDEAAKYYYTGLEIAEQHNKPTEYAALSNNIGIVHKDRGEYSQAIDAYFKALEYSQATNDDHALANIYINISIIYSYQEKYEKALSILKKLLKRVENTDIPEEDRANIHNNIAQVYIGMDNSSKAIEHLKIALAINQEIGNKEGMSLSYQEIARIKAHADTYHEAEEYYKKALDLTIETGALSNQGDIYFQLGNLAYYNKDYQQAEDYYLSSYKQFEDLKMTTKLVDICEELSSLYLDTEDYFKSCMYTRKLLDLRKELFSLEKHRLIEGMQAKFEIQERDSEIKQLNIKQETLQQANQELELFAGKAAHDLKEPIRVIKSFSSLLLKRYEAQLDSSGQEFLNFIHESSSSMDTLVADMLKFARSGGNQADTENINLNDLLLVVQNNLHLAIKDATANIQITELPNVKAAKVAMIQLFQNIIANALKFRKPDHAPIIRINAQRYDDNFYQISIQDNGIGIPQNRAKDVFTIFQRLNARQDYEGSGIGLATCKKIIDCLGGKIWLDSQEGEGTTFHFLLPKI